MNDDTQLFCTFEAAGRLFGVPLIDIKEVTADAQCTPIPHAPECVQGYVNIRGQIVLGLDLQRLLHLPADDRTAKCLVIFKPTIGPAFGLLVDEVGEIASVRNQDIAPSEKNPNVELEGPSDLIPYICRLADRLLVVLDAKRILPIIEKELQHSF
jgi:purine-binding chemotaxis protein CheW